MCRLMQLAHDRCLQDAESEYLTVENDLGVIVAMEKLTILRCRFGGLFDRVTGTEPMCGLKPLTLPSRNEQVLYSDPDGVHIRRKIDEAIGGGRFEARN